MKRISLLLTAIMLLVTSLTALANNAVSVPTAVCSNVTFPIDGQQANAGTGTNSNATGTGTFSLDTINKLITYTISYDDTQFINGAGTQTAAHFHGPAAAGSNGDVQVNIGTANPATASASLTDEQIGQILNDLWYVNIHTTAVGGGEIRGQVNGSECVADVALNEIRIDQPGADNDEYFELFGAANTSLDGLSYIVLGDSNTNGSGNVEAVVDLSGQTIPANGYFVAAESSFTLGTANFTTTLNFENSDNVTHILVMGFTGSVDDDLDTDDDGVLDSTPWMTVVDAVGLVESTDVPASGEFYYGAALGFTDVGPSGTFVPAHVYRFPDGNSRVPNGDWNIGEFDPVGGDDSPGGANSVPTAVTLSNTTTATATPLIVLAVVTLFAGMTLFGVRRKA